MFRRSWKLLLIGVVVAVAMTSVVDQANAWWGWRCYSPCYSPCYASCYTPCYTSCCYYPCGGWYVGYRCAPVRRCLYRPCCYWGSSCCYSSCCWTSCSYSDTCCDSAPETTATDTTPTQAPPLPEQPALAEPPTSVAPALPPDPLPDLPGEPELPADPAPMLPPLMTPELPGLSPAPGTEPLLPDSTAPLLPDSTGVSTRENSGLLTISVPYDAKVTVNGLLTRSKGSRRQFVSYGLKPGYSYRYEVRAEVVRNNQRVEDVQTIVLTAGDAKAVAFGFNALGTEALAAR